jgi:uncharacterized protein (DUF885 family)
MIASLAVWVLTLRLAAAPAPDDSSRRLAAAVDEYWRHLERTSVSLRLRRGLPITELPDPSLGQARREAQLGRRLLAALEGLDERGLTGEELNTAGALRAPARDLAEAERHYWLLPRITPYASPLLAVHQVFTSFAFTGSADGERYLDLLDRYARLIGELEAITAGQTERGIRIPRPELPLVRAPIEAARRAAGESLFRPAAARLSGLPEAERQRLVGAIERRIDERVNTALDALLTLIGPGYEQAAPAGVGLEQFRGGAAAYRYLARVHTTLEIDPEQVHRTGLTELERIGRELDAVRRELEFAGSLADFRRFLKSDPRFFSSRPETQGERLLAAYRRIEPLVPRYFLRSPKAPAGVERLDPALERGMTFGYYDPPRPGRERGIYYYNGSNSGERSLLFAPALVYHELVPGHHFQIALQRETSTLPPFRQESFATVFVEGWAEYASDLAGEMGLYADPYDRAGRLMMDAFLAARLVVDTGMNALGWSRERAMEFMREHTLQSESEIATETLRYSCDIPGQALAYKLGALRLRELRARAERELGARFDLRRFHDAVLSPGAMPMPALEAHIQRWIDSERAPAPASRR